jgi:crotonobetainyl-CoA:carnitine CoA-transferase CaiB-like acyl-CoA transferase
MAIHEQPLAGIRVLDLCMAWAGPLATRILADLGAEVVKIEAPQHMDRWRGGTIASDIRENYPDGHPGPRPYNRYASANTQNGNKLSLALDLKKPAGQDVFRRLVEVSDLVAENFSAGAMGRLGLEYPRLREMNPSIIVLSLPAMGKTGPESGYVGHSNFVEDIAGNTFLFGYPGGPALHTGTAWGDPIAGVNAAAAAMIALLHRDLTGEGQHIDLSHLEAAIPFLAEAVLDCAINGRIAERTGNLHPWMAPHGSYRCRGADEWIAIAVGSDAEWTNLVEAMGNPAWAQDSRFASSLERWRHHDEIDRHLEEWTSGLDKQEAMVYLQSRGVPAGAVLLAGELCENAHLTARGFLEEVVHPEAGAFRVPRQPWILSGTPPQTRRPPPCFAEHNHQVLHSILGMTDDEIAALEEAGAVAREPLPQYGV